jgi:hypothetical protein
VIGKGIVRCTDSMTLIKILHAPFFSMNLISISTIIYEQKYIMTFDISEMIFQEKGQVKYLGLKNEKL